MADNFIFIDKNTSFNGTITADKVVVEGAVQGDINARDRILIKNGAVVKGTIQTQKLLFEEGGQHDGLIRLWNEPEVSKSITNGLPEQPIEENYVNKPKSNEALVEQNPEKPAKKKPEKKEVAAERLW